MISIVMPTYERAATLPRAIDSVLVQTWGDWELIVVDDGSTDATPAVLADYRDPRIRVFRHGDNRGVTAAKNSGFDHISGEWFTVLDSDDELVPDALATLHDVATRTGATAITCNCVNAVTGQLTGHGWDADGWKTQRDMAGLSGEHWGMQQTALLGAHRFDERLPGMEGILWTKITHAAGRRYYLHRGLRIYHTEGADRVSVTPRTRREQLAIDRAIGEDAVYLDILRVTNPTKYRRMVQRARRARLLSAIIPGPVRRASRRDGAA